ncbi:hypothetical protein HY629_02685 [Candidatus Uhrbacteria bacterium]|nr:hypothetical protein [Candidatus Uhrbacteria bacterium]
MKKQGGKGPDEGEWADVMRSRYGDMTPFKAACIDMRNAVEASRPPRRPRRSFLEWLSGIFRRT